MEILERIIVPYQEGRVTELRSFWDKVRVDVDFQVFLSRVGREWGSGTLTGEIRPAPIPLERILLGELQICPNKTWSLIKFFANEGRVLLNLGVPMIITHVKEYNVLLSVEKKADNVHLHARLTPFFNREAYVVILD